MSAAQARAATVEIAGFAGAGKSTLAHTLCTELGARGGRLRPPEPRRFTLHARGVPRLATLASQWIAAGRGPTWTELKLMSYLAAWNPRVAGHPGGNSKATLLDQGPVYALARLGQVDPPLAGIEPHGQWWNALVDRLVEGLDLVIWLDAPTEVLRSRVNARSKWHEIKGIPKLKATAFIDRFLASYETVLAAVERRGGPLVLRYDTTRLRAAEIASNAVEELARLSPGFEPRHGTPYVPTSPCLSPHVQAGS